MTDSGGSASDRKRVLVDGPNVARVIAALAEAEGIELVEGDAIGAAEVDLIVLESASVDEVRAAAGERTPVLVIAPRRLRSKESSALLEAGARKVMDAHVSLIDLAAAFFQLVFDTFAEQRRQGRRAGGLSVRFRSSHAEGVGRLVGIARSGGFVETRTAIAEGTPLDLELEIAGRRAPVRGRVAFAGEHGFAVEFAYEHGDVAPELAVICSNRLAASV